MIFTVLFIVCGIVQIMGRPYSETDTISVNDTVNGVSQQIPPWPLPNTYLLPKMLNVDDIINITVFIADTPELSIKLMSQDDNTKKDSSVLCTVLANSTARTVSILDENGEEIAQDEIEHFFHKGNESILNIWIKRRINASSQDGDVIEINSKTYSQAFIFQNVDNLRYLQFHGENVKVTDLGFKFAID